MSSQTSIHYPGLSGRDAVTKAFLGHSVAPLTRREKVVVRVRETKNQVACGEWRAFKGDLS